MILQISQQHDFDLAAMRMAYEQALLAQAIGEVPVGAVLFRHGECIAKGHNRNLIDSDPTAHAEIVTLRQAGLLEANYRLPKTTLYVTLEPCAMCAGAIILARVERVVFATADPKSGAAGSVFQVLNHAALNHQCQLSSNILQAECSALLKRFFLAKRGGQ